MLIDDNAISCFVDDLGVTCWVDDLGQTLCCGDGPTSQPRNKGKTVHVHSPGAWVYR